MSKTLDSILSQTYPAIEVVAVNDGSTDGSLSILSDYAARYPDRVVVLSQSNSGQTRARNRGISEARGEYIAFLDSDDTWVNDKISKQLPLFKDKVGLVYSGINEVDDCGRLIGTILPEPTMRGDIYRHLLVRNRMTGSSVVVTRKALDQVGGFDESFRAAENWDLWIRISSRFEADFVEQPLVNYLRHSGNMSHDSGRMAEGAWSILQKHLPEMPDDENLRKSYMEAYAYYYYSRGVQHFGRHQYREARKMFWLCWNYLPNYRDSITRLCRCFLGRRLNQLLSNAKPVAKRLMMRTGNP